MHCNWQQPDWPGFRNELAGVTDLLLAFADHAGRVGGLLEGLSDELGTEATLDLMISEAICSSAIEGEILDREGVMSSIRNRLGLNALPQPVHSRLADGAGEQIHFLVRKSRFFQRYGPTLNGRQSKVLRRMFEAGPAGFTGGMNARKYVALAGTSKATATRDLQHLTQLGALTAVGDGRSTRYELRLLK